MVTWLKGNAKAASAMKRAIILKYMFVKGLATPPRDDLANIMSQWSSEEKSSFVIDTEQRFNRAVDRLKDSGLWQDVEEAEREFLKAGIEQMTPQQLVDASWLAEPIVCLFWALKMIPELPPYDHEVSPELFQALPENSSKEAIKQAKLRPEQEIKKQRDIAELWHWRARTRSLQEEGRMAGQAFGGYTIEQIIELSSLKGFENGDLPQPIGSDFPVTGKPYRDISAEQFVRLTSIAQERHKALNWLCGLSPNGLWADTPTGT